MAKTDLTAERLRELLDYNPETGIFSRKVNSRRRPSTIVRAGGLGNRGYVSIYVDAIVYLAHRLAWLYVYGEWPNMHIDHINGVRNDNRLCNLREADNNLNAQNRKSAPSSKKSGLPLGVSMLSNNLQNKFMARITVNGNSIHLGYFPNADAAQGAYVNAKRMLHKGCTI